MKKEDYLNMMFDMAENFYKPINTEHFESFIKLIQPLPGKICLTYSSPEDKLNSIYHDCKIVDDYFKYVRKI